MVFDGFRVILLRFEPPWRVTRPGPLIPGGRIFVIVRSFTEWEWCRKACNAVIYLDVGGVLLQLRSSVVLFVLHIFMWEGGGICS